MLRIGIYDRYLSTYGGGERYSCKAAEILSKQKGYSVDLLSDLYVDLEKLSKRLNLDLSDVNLNIFPFISEEYANRITKNYDIFINATYLSSLPAHSKRNIYICYFPTPFDVDFKLIHKFLLLFRLPALWLFRIAEKMCNGFREIEVEKGLYEPKRFMLGRGSWSSGDLILKYNPGDIKIGLKNPKKSNLDKIKVKIKAESKGNIIKKELSVGKGEKEVIDIGAADSKTIVRISSDTFFPESGDSRKLGIALYDMRPKSLFKKAILKFLGYIPLFLITYPKDLGFLKTYEIVSISEYSKKWVKKLWKRDSKLLFPPVDIKNFKPAKKEKIILSVGRFFPEHHNKKQLELARTFKHLIKEHPGIMQGYKLYLVGGVSQRESHLDYVEKVKKESEGYPIKVLTNIEYGDLIDIFSKSLVFWHASGMGEDEEKHPEKFEHFGITTVEAMASGCIPIVINKGGQKEIIEDGKNGFLFGDIEILKDMTLKVCSSKINIEKIRANAIARVNKFSNENFQDRLLKIIREG